MREGGREGGVRGREGGKDYNSCFHNILQVCSPKNGKKNCVIVSIQKPGFPNAAVTISCNQTT